MKVLQILPELNSGGVERGTLEVATHLVEQGHQSVVVSNGGELVAQLEAQGSRHLTLPVHKKTLLSLRQVAPLRRLLHEEAPDIIHARSRLPAWLAYLAWRKLNRASRPRFVTTMHGLHSVNAYSRIMTRGERVIAVSQCTRDYILQHYPKTDPKVIRVIPRGVDPVQYPHGYRPPAPWLAKWRYDHPELVGKFVLSLPARLTRLKGHDDFIYIVARLKQAGVPVHGLIVGGSHARKKIYADYLHLQTREETLEENITFLGHRTDLREILAISDVVLSLSTKPESFGRVTLEALSLGKPVVAYSHGGVAEQLQHFLPEGAIAPGDIPAVTALLQDWYRNDPPTPSPDNPYTLQAMLSSTLEVYQELLDSG